MIKSETIEPWEVEYYDRLAQHWWDPQGKFWPLHHLNALRVQYIRQALCNHFGRRCEEDKPLAELKAIDIGCGGGILSESMATLGASVCGIDVVEKGINVARQHSRQQGLAIRYEHATVEDVLARGEKYDVVLNMEVVEHVANLPAFMSACTGLVKPHGIMFIATINRTPLSWLFAIVGAEYILGWLPKGTHSWLKFVTPGELEQLLGHAGLQVTASTGVRINPLTRHFSLSKRLWVNYMLSAIHAT